VLRIALVALALAGGCTRKPSAQECQEAFAQLERIAVEGKDKGTGDLGRAYLDSFKTEFLDRCTKDGTRDEVECIQRARTLEDLDKCAGVTK
jgi:hypothetical protein